MTPFRRLLRTHRRLAACLVAAALLMRMLVPAGYMPVLSADGIAMTLCSGHAAPQASLAAMPGMTHHPETSEQDGRAMPCGFVALSAASLAAVGAVLLAGAIAFPWAALFRAVASGRLIGAACFRPPLRGPPVRS